MMNVPVFSKIRKKLCDQFDCLKTGFRVFSIHILKNLIVKRLTNATSVIQLDILYQFFCFSRNNFVNFFYNQIRNFTEICNKFRRHALHLKMSSHWTNASINSTLSRRRSAWNMFCRLHFSHALWLLCKLDKQTRYHSACPCTEAMFGRWPQHFQNRIHALVWIIAGVPAYERTIISIWIFWVDIEWLLTSESSGSRKLVNGRTILKSSFMSQMFKYWPKIDAVCTRSSCLKQRSKLMIKISNNRS